MRTRIMVTLAVLVVAAAGCTSSTATDDTVAASPSSSAPARMVTVEDATEINDAYFTAYEAGDVTAMIDLLTPDAELVFFGEEFAVEAHRLLYEWKVAEGTAMLPRDCTASEIDDRDAVSIDCEYAQHEYVSRVVDGPPVPHTMTMVVGPDGIERLESDFGEPSFDVYYEPFFAWMRAHHPEVADSALVGEWQSVEEAREGGALVAQYADEWAAWLEDNPSCTWRDTHCQDEGA